VLAVATAALALPALALPSSPTEAAPAADGDYSGGSYIVVLAHPPAASYRGGFRTLARTAPRAPAAYDASSVAVDEYTRFLRREQHQVADAVGADPIYHYTTSLNGFAAPLTAAQAGSLSRRDGVVAVVPDRVRQLQDRPSAARLTVSPDVATTPGPRRHARAGAGAGVVIGVVDTGIDSDSPAFARRTVATPTTYTGACSAGGDPDPAAAFRCGGKLLGGRYYARGQGGGAALWSGEYRSPEDQQGHGTRVASAAAGAATVRSSESGAQLARLTGASPGALLASYKVCWAAEDGGASCLTSDTLAGIDQAVADGVDVLSHGVAGAATDIADPVERAFLHAADAGVFVATAAGNGGPRPASTVHPGPWLTTAGAIGQDPPAATLVLGNGERHEGTSVAPADVAAPVLLGADAAADGAGRSEARLCLPGSLDPDAVSGAIVVCDRGTSDRVEKSVAVGAAGGVGMVLVNQAAGSLEPDLHAVPSVHLPAAAYDSLYAYAGSADAATAVIRADAAGGGGPPPRLARFSGRGPTRAIDGDLLKPDLVAPGVQVLTALPGHEGDGGPRSRARYGLSTGTSVAAAQVAGHAARVIQAHPDWSPMAVKSALMTTAQPGAGSAGPFDEGAGAVRARRAVDPGLVVDSGWRDWAALLPGDAAGGTSTARPLPARDLNVPSVVIGDLTGRRTVDRTVTNVGADTATYSADTVDIDGISITALPSVFTLRPGERQTISLRIERDNAALGRYETGALVLNDGPAGHRVRLPVALRPVGIEAPAQVRLDDRLRSLTTTSGIRGTLRARVHGPVQGEDTDASGSDTGGVDFDAGMPGLWWQTIDVGGPREWWRIQALADDPGDDLDVFLVDEGGKVVASSATPKPSETVTVRGLGAGTYRLAVQPWFVADPSGDTTFTVRTFDVAPPATGALSVEPRRQGASPARRNTWSLGRASQSGTPWFGWIGWHAGDDQVGRTLVSWD
jgi:hypothetical protein